MTFAIQTLRLGNAEAMAGRGRSRAVPRQPEDRDRLGAKPSPRRSRAAAGRLREDRKPDDRVIFDLDHAADALRTSAGQGAPSVPDLKFARSLDRARSELQTQEGTLESYTWLVSLSIPKFVDDRHDAQANFGIGTLAAGARLVEDRRLAERIGHHFEHAFQQWTQLP